jgi:hypothetical protein
LRGVNTPKAKHVPSAPEIMEVCRKNRPMGGFLGLNALLEFCDAKRGILLVSGDKTGGTAGGWLDPTVNTDMNPIFAGVCPTQANPW